jgi:hypothetical protein
MHPFFEDMVCTFRNTPDMDVDMDVDVDVDICQVDIREIWY